MSGRGTRAAWRELLTAALGYLAITLVMTWPVVARVATDAVPDVGDPLLNAWILGWNGRHLLAWIGGDLGAFRGYWDANIFHPEPLTLTYSEHLFAQGLQGLPIYAATGNLLLAHNLLFLSTFVLSALGVYLLVRDLTGSRGAAFLAGLLYGFAPYRINQFPHLQILSSQWMPFALFGLRRFFVTGRWRYVAVATMALLVQNMSCGYYLVYFAPFVALYVVYELVDRGLWASPRTWSGLAATATVTAALTWPFVSPYLASRAGGLEPRPRQEIEGFSADVYAYLTANPLQRAWGWLQTFPKPEGELFTGAIPVLLAAIGVLGVGWDSWRRAGTARGAARGWRRWVVLVAAVLVATQVLAFVAALLSGGSTWRVAGLAIRTRGLVRPLVLAALGSGVVLVLSSRGRAFVRGRRGSIAAFCVVALLLSVTLSFGPRIRAMGRTVATGPYEFLYTSVPGYDGLRVPARHAMIGALFLAVLGGLGADVVRRRTRFGSAALGALSVVFLLEASPVPVPTNQTWEEEGVAPLPARVATVPPPAVYAFLAGLPHDAVVAEFPFGVAGYELQYVYYSASHWRRLLNGYSGQVPHAYAARASRLRHPQADADQAWAALVGAGATHAVVHGSFFTGDEASLVRAWLESRGASLVATFGPDVVYRLN